MRRAALFLAAATALSLTPAISRAGAESDLDRLRHLVQTKRQLQREAVILKQEAAMAATHSPYLFLDTGSGNLEFRVRGKAFKTYTFKVTLDEAGARPADPEQVWAAVDGPLVVDEIQAAHPELIPPDPETGREAGLVYSDPNQLAEETGVIPLRTDAGILGVDVPSEYYIKLDGDVVFHVRTPDARGLHEKAVDRLSAIAAGLKATFAGWFGGRDLPDQARPKLELYLLTDVDTAKNLHHSLLPGEKIFIVPPAAPPIVVLAAAADSGKAVASR